MRKWMLLAAVGFVLCAAAPSSADSGSLYHLAFPALHPKTGERLAKFTLNVRSAMVVGFRSIPVGWRIDVNNDPSWMTRVSGIAIVGAADLEPTALRPWFLSLLAEPGIHREQGIKIVGTLTLTRGDSSRVIEIFGRDVALTPAVGGND